MTIFQMTKNLIITRLTWSFCLKYKYEERATLLMIKLVLDIDLTQSSGCEFERIHMVWKERVLLPLLSSRTDM
jgi:hypothetical protein